MPAPSHQGTRSDTLRRIWRSRGAAACALLPLAGLYGALSALQRRLYAWGLKPSAHPGVPTVVIGNVIAGGAGKTPVTLATVSHLQARGLQVGIISRGYGRSSTQCQQVLPHSTPEAVGDEPLLMARHSGVPVFVAQQRLEAARALLHAYPDTQVLVCDDGLQHLALQRDIEVCVFNDEGIGNGWLLPAGPLREPWPRPVSAVLHSGPVPARTPANTSCFSLHRQLAPYAINQRGDRVALPSLHAQAVHAVAGIARPEDFFRMLQDAGLSLHSTEALPDHYNFEGWQRPQDAHLCVVCTEKDAAKIWQHLPQAWAIPLQVQVEPAYFALLDQLLCLSSPH